MSTLGPEGDRYTKKFKVDHYIISYEHNAVYIHAITFTSFFELTEMFVVAHSIILRFHCNVANYY